VTGARSPALPGGSTSVDVIGDSPDA